jgi:8-oxo-dGTP pyrophosphatase MutT (NUDIX family)
MSMNREERSAGVLVLRWTKSGWQYLILLTTMMGKGGARKLDFPKGHVESGEEWMDAAIRETEEEAGIPERSLNFAWGDKYIDCVRPGKTCRIFVAWSDASPKIKRNPESGVYEHIGWKWLSLERDGEEANIHQYIRPAVEWARSVVLSHRVDSLGVRIPR